ncbi:rod shape-determining protein MreD [Cellulophaga sp. F20128]|nr:rod shape-determining protein MreD [Cellulophaga sp. F20128]MCK0157343.1 rod shape-determining protein MreD [Cellulophaga sp. F20128]
MNSKTIVHIIRFFFLVLAQVLVFNNLNFLGFINPMIYILYFYWYPVKENRAILLLASFILGLTIDLFSDTMAIHTVSCLTIAYMRSGIMRFCFGVNYDFQNFKLASTTTLQQITFLALLILFHHFIFFFLEIFSFSNLLLILKKVLIVGAASLVLSLLIRSLFSIQKK